VGVGALDVAGHPVTADPAARTLHGSHIAGINFHQSGRGAILGSVATPGASFAPVDPGSPPIDQEHIMITLARRLDAVRGSAIRDLLTLTARPEVISLAGGLPAADLLPRERIAAAAATVLTDPAAVQYSETAGIARLREAVAAHESDRCGRAIGAADVVVTSGSQQALDLVARALLDPGDAVVVEDPAYVGALQVFQAAGAELHGIALDESGMRVDVLADRLAAGLRPRIVHTVSSFHNPRGVTLAPERRAALAALAERYGFLVVEDDPYGLIAFDGAPPRPGHPSSPRPSSGSGRVLTSADRRSPRRSRRSCSPTRRGSKDTSRTSGRRRRAVHAPSPTRWPATSRMWCARRPPAACSAGCASPTARTRTTSTRPSSCPVRSPRASPSSPARRSPCTPTRPARRGAASPRSTSRRSARRSRGSPPASHQGSARDVRISGL
jgi:hypothetical protein